MNEAPIVKFERETPLGFESSPFQVCLTWNDDRNHLAAKYFCGPTITSHYDDLALR